MKYALAIVLAEGDIASSTQALRRLSDSIDTSGTRSQTLQCLNVGAYLLSLEHGLHDLAHLLEAAEQHKLPLQVLFFEERPSFVVTRFDKKPA